MIARKVITAAKRMSAAGAALRDVAAECEISYGTAWNIRHGRVPKRRPPRSKPKATRRDPNKPVKPYRCSCGLLVIYNPCKFCGALHHEKEEA